MGWDSCDNWKKKADVAADLERSIARSGWTVHGKASTREALYYAVTTSEGASFIYVALVEKRGGSYAVKTLDESMGPCANDCPVRLLDLIPCPANEYAKAWRESVRKNAEASTRSFNKGDKVKLYGKFFTIAGKLPGTRSIGIVEEDTGRMYRLKKSQLSELELVVGKADERKLA